MKSQVIAICVAMVAIVGLVGAQTPIPDEAIDYETLFEQALNLPSEGTVRVSTTTTTSVPATSATTLTCDSPNLCVPYYLCGNGTYKDGILDLDNPNNPCSYVMTCCPLFDVQHDRITKAPPLIELPATVATPVTSQQSVTPSNRPTPAVTRPTPVTSRPTVPAVQPTPKPQTGIKLGPCGIRNKDGVIYKLQNNDEDQSEFAEFPWTILLLKEDSIAGLPRQIFWCAGSLIHPKAVLTAAQCVNKKPKLIARAGEWDTNIEGEGLEHQDREVVQIIVHEEFHKGGLFNDIALLILESPYELAINVQPACLPKKNSKFDSIPCTASGWGAHEAGGDVKNIMKKVDLAVVPRDRCQDQFRTIRKSQTYELHESYLCAGGEVGKDTCTGDRGSPLVCPVNEDYPDQYVQTGIVSWGRGCGQGIPGIYSNIAVLRDWIDGKMRDQNLDTIYYEY